MPTIKYNICMHYLFMHQARLQVEDVSARQGLKKGASCGQKASCKINDFWLVVNGDLVSCKSQD